MRPDSGRFSKAMHKRATRVWNGAITEFIQTVAAIVADHQDSGMSLASLFPTAAKVKAAMPAITGSPKKTYIDIYGTPHTGSVKSEWRGLAAGAADKCSKISYGRPDYPRFFFRFQIRVYQYMMNEVGAWNAGVAGFPFHSIEAGALAFQEYLETHSDEIIPRPAEYLEKVFVKG